MADNKTTDETATIVTPIVRVSYPYLFSTAPNKKAKPGDRGRYSIVGLILPPEKMINDTERERWTILQKGIIAAGQSKMGVDKFNLFYKDGKIKLPLRKDVESSGYPPEYACYIRAWSYQAPGVVSIYRDPVTKKAAEILDPNAVYPGCWARFSVRPWCGFHEEGGWAVGLQLRNVQWVKDDTRLDGKSAATDEFDAEEEMPENFSGRGSAKGAAATDKDELAALLGS